MGGFPFVVRPTQRALDRWVRCGFSSIFLASSFFCSQALSTPAHLPVTQTVGAHEYNFLTMPKRTNDFQRLIYLVRVNLADGATVTESKMLKDRITGTMREVDICIEGSVGG
jgi:hypothetical protein